MTTQTRPLSFSTQTTNTRYFNEMTTQTKPLRFSTQTTNTPYFNEMTTQTGPINFTTMTTQTQPAKEEHCQCEDNKSIQPFQSDFARLFMRMK